MRALLAALALAAGTSGAAPDAASRDALLAADADMAAARTIGAFLAHVADDAVFGSATGLAAGKTAIRERWHRLYEGAGPRLAWAPERAEVAGSGDLGFTTGRFRLEGRDDEGRPAAREGEYVTVWARAAGGAWRALFDLPLAQAEPARGLVRRTVRTRTSSAGDLEATVGRVERDGVPAGAWLTIRRRGGDAAWGVVLDTVVLAPP